MGRQDHARGALWMGAFWTDALCCSLLCLLFFNLYKPGVPNPGDLVLALPIAQELADPGLYPSSDLVVDSGKRMPFHVYRLAVGLYRAGADVDLVWYVLLQLFLFATFLGQYALGFATWGRRDAAGIGTALLAALPVIRGALHWSQVPLTSLVTAQVVLPLAYGVLLLLWRDRLFGAWAVAGVAFLVHPYVGLLCLAACGGITVFDGRSRPWGQRVAAMALGGAIAAPNALVIVSQLPANFQAGGAEAAAAFFAQFRVHAWHAYVEDHWHEGYGWFFLHLAGMAWFARALPSALRRRIVVLSLVLLAIVAVYVVNLYLVRNRTLALTFLFRATYLLKPVLLAVSGAGVWVWLSRPPFAAHPPWVRASVAGLFALAALSPGARSSEAFSALAYGAWLWVGGGGRIARATAVALLGVGTTLLVTYFLTHRWGVVMPSRMWDGITTGLCVLLSLPLALSAADGRHVEPTVSEPAGRRLRGIGATAAVLGLQLAVAVLWLGPGALQPAPAAARWARVRMSQPHPQLAGLHRWVEDAVPRGALVAVPPADSLFESFRHTARRGVYVTLAEVNQLAFDTSVYAEAQRRLDALGVKTLGRHTFDARAYHDLPFERWVRLHREEGVGYAVFFVGQLSGRFSPYPPAFYDGTIVVFDLADLAARVGGESASLPD